MEELAGLTATQKQQLEDIVGSAIAKSVESLSKLSQNKWDIHAIRLCGGSFPGSLDHLEKMEDSYAGVKLGLKGEFSLIFLILFSPESSRSLVEALIEAYQVDMGGYAQAFQDTLGEVGNILAGTFLNDLIGLFPTPLILTTPMFMQGKKRDLLEGSMKDLDNSLEELIWTHATASCSKLQTDCDILIALDRTFLEVLAKPR